MSDFGWMVLENIVWAVIFAGCVFFLEGGWKWLGVLPLLFINTPRSK